MTSPAAAAPTLRAVLRSWQLRRLVLAHLAGTLAQQVLTLALGLYVLERTSSGPWVSVTVALAFLPYALLSGYGGTLADRCSRSAVLSWSALIRAGCALVLTLGLVGDWPLPVLIGIAALAGVMSTPSYPALAAATPECVPDEALPAANALVSGVENVGWIAGPGVLGLVVLAGGSPTAVVAATAALFLVAALASAGVGLPRPARTEPTGWHADLLAAVRLVLTEASLRRPMAVAVVDNIVYGYLVVLLVLLGTDPGTYGALNTALTAGALLAMPLVGRLSGRVGAARLLGAVMAGLCLCLLLLGFAGPTWVGLLLVAGAGATTLVAEVLIATILQRSAADALHARIFGLYDQLAVGSIALGSLLAGPLVQAIGLGPATVAVAAVCLLLVVATSAERGLS